MGSADGAKGCLVNTLVGKYALWSALERQLPWTAVPPSCSALVLVLPFDLRDIIEDKLTPSPISSITTKGM